MAKTDVYVNADETTTNNAKIFRIFHLFDHLLKVGNILLDGRNIYESDEAESLGFDYSSIGRYLREIGYKYKKLCPNIPLPGT